MYHTRSFIAALTIIITIAACRHTNRRIWPDSGSFGNRVSTVIINSDTLYEKILLEGRIVFNDNKTAIASLSPGGSVKYRRNDKRVVVTGDRDGAITYEIYEDDERLAPGERSSQILSEAVREMAARGLDRAKK